MGSDEPRVRLGVLAPVKNAPPVPTMNWRFHSAVSRRSWEFCGAKALVVMAVANEASKRRVVKPPGGCRRSVAVMPAERGDAEGDGRVGCWRGRYAPRLPEPAVQATRVHES